MQSHEIVEGWFLELDEEVYVASLPLLPGCKGTEQADALHFIVPQRIAIFL